MIHNRRLSPRYDTHLAAHLSIGDEVLSGHIANISYSGCFIEVFNPPQCALHSRLTITIETPYGAATLPVQHAHHQQHGIGFKWLNADQGAYQCISRTVSLLVSQLS